MPRHAAFDLVIRAGTVIDGTGAPALRADVGVSGDRIAAIGEIDTPAARVIDADGLVVAPGFVDVHAHDDGAILSTPMDFKLMQGVTTVVVGNCGAGLAPRDPSKPPAPGTELILGPSSDAQWQTFPEYIATVARAPLTINAGCFVPHGAVRYCVMGMERREPDEGELGRMREAVVEGMAAGALGLSTGLIYPPGAFARTDEVIEIARAAGEHGGLYMSHIRNEADRLLEAVAEAIRIGREAGLPVQLSHHKASDRANWGKTRESIALIERERDAGVDVAFDAYPYTAGSTILRIAAGLQNRIEPEELLVASVREHREYEGKTLAAISESLDLPPEQALRRVLEDEPEAVAVFFSMDEADVRRVLSHPLCMIGSDGIPSPTGKPHPRLYGTFARVLGTYCRDEGLFTLEEALRKMTSLPARRFRLGERGELREGWHADIVVFDPKTVADVATYEEPRQYPAGIECVIVNGQIAADGGTQTSARAGRLLRRNGR